MVILAGLDLAWTATHESGICLIATEAVDAPVALLSLEARRVSPGGLADELASLGADVVAAVDAPLIRRDGCVAERELGRTFGRFKAGAYLASVAFLESRKPPLTAGLLLGEALGARGFEFDPLRLCPAAEGRFAFEMYPHAFHVAAFGLNERLAYKNDWPIRRGRAVAGWRPSPPTRPRSVGWRGRWHRRSRTSRPLPQCWTPRRCVRAGQP